jgi:hypothetical protein
LIHESEQIAENLSPLLYRVPGDRRVIVGVRVLMPLNPIPMGNTGFLVRVVRVILLFSRRKQNRRENKRGNI